MKDGVKQFENFRNKVDKMLTNVEGLTHLSVEVGLPDDRIHNPSGLTLAKIGAIHEFGLGNVPERSFLRGAVRAGKAEIKKNFKIVIQKVTNGDDINDSMQALALFGENLVKEYINEGNATPLKSPATLKRNPSKTTPLINTGEMKNSIIGIVVGD